MAGNIIAELNLEKEEVHTGEDFNRLVQDLAITFQSLIHINNTIFSLPASTNHYQHVFTMDNGREIKLSRNDVKAINEAYYHTILNLKNHGKKPHKNKNKENHVVTLENAKGINAPVFIGGGLSKLFSYTRSFGPLHPLNPKAREYLLDNLPELKKGYAIKNACSTLLHIYSYCNDENIKIHEKKDRLLVNDEIQEAFNGTTPCLLYRNYDGKNDKHAKFVQRKDMRTWARENNCRPLNTFEMIIERERLNREANQKEEEEVTKKKTSIPLEESLREKIPFFKSYYYQVFICLNTLSPNILEEHFHVKKEEDYKKHNPQSYEYILGYMSNPENILKFSKEFEIIKKTNAEWKTLKNTKKE